LVNNKAVIESVTAKNQQQRIQARIDAKIEVPEYLVKTHEPSEQANYRDDDGSCA
jgi:hypothetical protein